jgi:hypothetical protein
MDLEAVAMSKSVVWALCVPAALLLLIANLAFWAWLNVVNTDRFVELASEPLQQEDVRDSIARVTLEQTLSPDRNLRPRVEELAVKAISGVLDSDRFQALFERLASAIHQAIKAGGIDRIAIDIRPLHPLIIALSVAVGDQGLIDTLRNTRPPDEVVLFEGRDFRLTHETMVAIPWIAIITLLVGGGLLALAVWKARDRRHALRVGGWLVLALFILLAIALFPARSNVLSAFPSEDAENVARALFSAFAGRLFWQSLVLAALAGVMIFLAGDTTVAHRFRGMFDREPAVAPAAAPAASAVMAAATAAPVADVAVEAESRADVPAADETPPAPGDEERR